MNDKELTRAAPAPDRQLDTTTPTPTPVAEPQADETSKAPQSQWNTKNLGLRLGSDLASAASAASVIAPVISIIDRSVMENASGRSTLAESLKASLRTLLSRPHTVLFSRPVALIFMVYGGTYLTANLLDTVSSTARNKPATYVSSGTDKFVCSSAANVGLGIYKDQVYVRLFGPGGPPRPVPLPSFALFALRDCLTIFASFNIPPVLGPALSERMSAEMRRRVSGETLMQFTMPAALQLLSTPIHLLGLDLYNRPAVAGAPTWAARLALVKQNWLISCAARVGRIVPAYGLGGVVNTKVRRNLMEKLS